MGKSRLFLSVLAALCLPVSVFAATVTINGVVWTYTTYQGKATVGGGNYDSTAVPDTTSGSISVPGSINGTSVTAIANWAFFDCSRLVSVTIPGSVETIGKQAFDGCTGLTSVSIGNAVTTIDNGAFHGCTALRNLEIPGGTWIGGTWGVTTIGTYAFEGCTSLGELVIPVSVTSIGQGAFAGCSNLGTLFLPSSFAGKTGNLSIPATCNVVFYDGTLPVLTVLSPFGNVVPEPGSHRFAGGARVDCSASSPVAGPVAGVRYVCTGWTGAGDVPGSGTGTNAVFTIAEDSTIEWQWSTNVLVECRVVAGDSEQSFSEWREKDSGPVSFSFRAPGTHWIATMSGDTDSVVLDRGAKSVSMPADAPRCVVVSLRNVVEGNGPFPDWSDPDGFAAWSLTDEGGAADGYCLGSGAVAAGEKAATEISVEGPGLVEFDWKISASRVDSAYVSVDGTDAGSVSWSTDWTHVEIPVAGAGPHTVRWTYEKKSAQAVGADAAFLDNVRWRPLLALSVSSAAGRPSPKRGTNAFYHGDVVSATIAETKPPRGTRYTYLGWTGTGSVPASGTGTNAVFTIVEESAITWNWLAEHLIELKTAGAVASGFGSAWVQEGGTAVVSYRLLAGYDSLVLGGDAAGVSVDEAARTVTIPADGPRTVTLRTLKAIPLEDALDAPAVAWSTDAGASAWLGQNADTSDGEDAATSGAPSENGGTSVLTATVQGPGTLAWTWKLATGGLSGVDVVVDGTVDDPGRVSLRGTCDWTGESVVVEGEGPHTVLFVFWNLGTDAGDHAAIDRVTWTGAASAAAATQATPVPVPFEWLSGYGLAADGNYGGAAFAPAANPAYDVWQCWLAGISPVDPDAQFRAAIRMVDGEPVVTPDPDLGSERDYTVVGKASLEEYDWLPAGAASRFFRVKVSMPQ